MCVLELHIKNAMFTIAKVSEILMFHSILVVNISPPPPPPPPLKKKKEKINN